MKKYRFLVFFFLIPCWTACFEDKGNYVYRDMGDIVIENIPELIEILSNADPIVINPKVTSRLEGEIKDGNPNYQFIYQFEQKSGNINGAKAPWVILNPDGAMSIDTLATFPANAYIGWFTVKDLRTGLETYKTFEVKIASPTYEGWMILCNEGENHRVRFDMVAQISAERTIAVHDILKDLGLPDGQNARQLGFNPDRDGITGDRFFVYTETGGYQIDPETFKTNESYNVTGIDFIMPIADHIVCYATLNDGYSSLNNYWFCVTDAGNAYVKSETSAGAAFELPINASERGGKPEYKVAPYIGISMARPGNGKCALMYNIDRQCFVGWAYGANENARQLLMPLQDPAENKLFSYQTNKDLIYMEGTRFSGGIVYAVLQDKDGKRCVYGVNVSSSKFIQELAYEQINASEFAQATKFAFHSLYPFMFYAVKNKVYLYDFGTGTNYPLADIKLGDMEEITLLKFNLYQNPSLSALSNVSEEFMARQFDLIVGSYDKSGGNNGGKMGFYRINHTAHTVAKREEYTGFSRITDVLYRERRK